MKTKKTAVCHVAALLASLALICVGTACAETVLPQTWEAAVEAYDLPEIPYCKAQVRYDLENNKITVNGLASLGVEHAQLIYKTNDDPERYFIKPNVTVVYDGTYNAQADTWLFEDEYLWLVFNSASVGEGESLVFRFVKPLGETEDGWVREYRYEIRAVMEELQVGMYVEYRPAATQDEPEEMRLAVARVGNEYTLTLFDKGEIAASKTYGQYVESAPAAQDAGAPQPVEDLSKVEGLILSLDEADFLPKPPLPDYTPTLDRLAKEWLVRNIPENEYTELYLNVHSTDWTQEEHLALSYDPAQSAYACAPTQDAIALANNETTRIELWFEIPLPDGNGETYTQEYSFIYGSWRVMASAKHDGLDYDVYCAPDGWYMLYCGDGQPNARWYAYYDEEGKPYDVCARPDIVTP